MSLHPPGLPVARRISLVLFAGLAWSVLMLGGMATPRGAAAQNCTAAGVPSTCGGTRNVRVTVRRTVRMTVSPSSATLGAPNADDFAAGYSQAVGHAVEVKSNNAWRLLVRSTQANFSATGGARANKPRTDLQWAVDAAGPFNPINNTATEIASGGATAGTVVNIFYRMLWQWTLDRPGGYALPIQFTISAP